MALVRAYNLGGLQLGVSPFARGEGQFIRLVNVDSDPVGAKKKRAGYGTYLDNPDTSQVNSLWNWTRNDGTTLWNYRASGSQVYYSTQGTGAWTVCGNGTITTGGHIGYAILEDEMIIGDGTANTRYTTNGTSFTDIAAAPKAEFFVDYQNRIYAGGTASFLFYSTTGTAHDWTTDSTSLTIPGPGKLNNVIKVADRVITSKNSGVMHRWDGYTLVDLTTNLGPSSPYGVANVEDYRFYLNRKGVFGFGGDKPEIVSNIIEKQIYNDAGNGIVGTVFDNASGVAHRFNYLLAVGSVTDDLTGETVSNCVLSYDYQLDEWADYSLASLPTSWCSYKDASGNERLIFGDATGQCHTLGGTSTSDNGATIEAIMEFIFHGGAPEQEKKFNYLRLFFNPGCQAKVQVATSRTFTRGKLKWLGVGDVSNGMAEFRTGDLRGNLLFVRITEASTATRFNFYGLTVDYDLL